MRTAFLFLLVLTLVAYASVRGHDYITLDDPGYVSENAEVLEGLTGHGVSWAFSTFHKSNWHPLTWISHMTDVQFLGAGAGAAHLVNLLFHLLNVVLVFLVLRELTHDEWRALVVAALFALHPTHVESVAWVSERKDVLSLFWGMVGLFAYARYVRTDSGRQKWYVLMVVGMAASLLAKPMFVTFPFVLLLLDAWLRRDRSRRLLVEKLPLFALTIVSCVMTLRAQSAGGAVMALESVPLGERVVNALVSYMRYMGKTVWPTDLVVFYPLEHPSAATIFGAAVVVGGMTAVTLFFARRCMAALVGWLWFLGTLVPVIGLVQVGSQAMADRYTYLPSLGLFIMLAWVLPLNDVRRSWVSRSAWALTALVVIAFTLQTRAQAARWKDTQTLFAHAVSVMPDNHRAHYNLALGLRSAGDLAGAQTHLRSAMQLRPDWYEPPLLLATILRGQEPTSEALTLARRAVELNGADARGQYVMGLLLAEDRQFSECEPFLRRAIELNPTDPRPAEVLGNVYAQNGRVDDAVPLYESVLVLDQNNAKVHNNLGMLLGRQGKLREARDHFAAAVRADPDHGQARQNLERAETMLQRNPDGNR